MWNALDLVLGLVLLMYCLSTAVSEECNETDIIVGRLGGELEFKFLLSDLRDKYNKYISELFEENTTQNEIQNKDLEKESYIQFKKKMDSLETDTIYMNGKQTKFAGSRTGIFMTNDAFVVKKTKLQKEDAGIYWIEFKGIRSGQKVLIITGKPTINGRPPMNPVLKPEDNYISTIQLECHSVSTSIGECLPLNNQIYTVWYKNGMRMTDVDPTLSQINVNVDHNGGNFTCLVTDYFPCYQRLQTTKHYDDVLNIEKCNNVFENKTFILQPEYAPMDVKLEPDQREITVNTNEDLKVRCLAKCHPQCNVTWEKDYKVLRSNGSIFITENILRNDLVIENVNSSYEGVYVCLVKNIHGENKMDFTLSVAEAEEKAVSSVDNNEVVIVAVIVIVIVIVTLAVVVVVIMYRKCRNKKYSLGGKRLSGDIPDQEAMLDGNGKPEASTDNNSKNGDQKIYKESVL